LPTGAEETIDVENADGNFIFKHVVTRTHSEIAQIARWPSRPPTLPSTAPLSQFCQWIARGFHHGRGMAFDDPAYPGTRIDAIRDASHEGFQTCKSVVLLGRLGQHRRLEEYIQYCC
jgi:hypothetical protein